MAAPTPEVFLVLSLTTSLPLTGATPTFSYYAKETGSTVSQPSISEIGGGLYKFTPVFADTTHGICYVIATGGNPAYVTRYMRPTDYATDLLPDISAIEKGAWEIKQSGPNANKLLIYDTDNTTILFSFNLYDNAGSLTSVNPFKRVPA